MTPPDAEADLHRSLQTARCERDVRRPRTTPTGTNLLGLVELGEVVGRPSPWLDDEAWWTAHRARLEQVAEQAGA